MPDATAPSVAIVDYGVGNLFSVKLACEYAGLRAGVTSDPDVVRAADAVILPGIGAFGDAMERLCALEMVDAIREVAASEALLVGICLGMQLLMSESSEFGTHSGLNIVPGRVAQLDNPRGPSGPLKVPQIGWNQLRRRPTASRDRWHGSLLDGLPDGVQMYFAHSYCVTPADPNVVTATTTYGDLTFCSSFRSGTIFGLQCHPERSGANGLRVYHNLAGLLRAKRTI